MSFKNIILGTQRKSYTHDLSFDNNTTMDFGVLQPLLSQFMLPKSSIKVSSRQLVRLAPMPTPSFARMYLANYASFVKMTDVVPYYESLLSKIPFTGPSSTFQPVSMPYITNQSLLYFLLRDSFVECYQETSTPGKYQIVKDDPAFGALTSEFVSLFLVHLFLLRLLFILNLNGLVILPYLFFHVLLYHPLMLILLFVLVLTQIM